jgi:membrane protease YdiL (CAAX protease family)
LNELDASPIPDSPDPPFWSPWATIGWGLLVFTVFVLVQTGVVIVWSAFQYLIDNESDPVDLAARASFDGDLLAVATLVSAGLCGGLVVVLAWSKSGARTRESLALAPPSGATLTRWLILTAGLFVAGDALTWALGRPIVPEFMHEVIRTTTTPLLLWLAVIVAAPLFEELFFRGFLLEGLRRGRLRGPGSVAVTALFWASIHVQYGFYEIAMIFVFGLVLGLARIRSGSLWIPVAMHVTANLVATVEAHLVAGG